MGTVVWGEINDLRGISGIERNFDGFLAGKNKV